MKKVDQDELDRAIAALGKQDPILKRAIKKFGTPKSRRSSAGFATLARVVVDQQISTAAAASIWTKLRSSVGAVNAKNINQANEKLLKTAGLSAGKIKTLQTLAMAIEQRQVSLRSLNRKSDADVKAILTSLWGIGNWTAEIYLMFGMGRPDVWPAGDLALRTGWQYITDDESRISADDLSALAESWRPHRSAAAVLLWHCLRQSKSTL